jgi:hypothetical protein
MSYGNNKNTKGTPGWNVRESIIIDPNQVPSQKGRVDLSPQAFDNEIYQKGIRVKIYRTTYCPNVKSIDAAEHQIDCTLCHGSGYVDMDPIESYAFIQNQSLEKTMLEQGQLDGNTVTFTFLTGIENQYFTKIDVCDFTENYFQRVLRGTGTQTDVLKYHACRVNSIMDQAGGRYYQGVDFNIDPNGNIIWLARKPADNTIYSIHYEMHVQYRLVKAMHVARFTQWRTKGQIEFIKMNEQWMAMKEFLIPRLDKQGNNLQPQIYDPSRADSTGNDDGQA